MDTPVTLSPELRLSETLISVFVPASFVDFGWCLSNEFEPEPAKEERFFRSCTELTTITIDPNHPLYASENGVMFNKDKTVLIVYPKGRQGDYVIPKSVVKIRERAFSYCTGLTSVTIPASVTVIECSAFEECISLKTAIIPDSVTKIEPCTFWGCANLASIDIPNSVVYIGCFVFWKCEALASIFIPASLIEIGMRHNKTDSNNIIVSSDISAFVTVDPNNPVYTSKDGKLAFKMQSDSGRVGELEWTFSKGVLTISGHGELPDYDDSRDFRNVSIKTDKKRSPWYPLRKLIKKVVLSGNISKKGMYAFDCCENLSSVTFEECRIDNIVNRATQGYTYLDLWHFTSWFSGQITSILQDIKPKSLLDVQETLHQELKSAIDRMIFCFSEIESPSDTKENPNMKKNRENMKNEGFALLCKYFDKLNW